MRKIVYLFCFLCLSGLFFTSCKSTLPARFESFVNSVEKRCDSFSEDDWNKANDKFSKLMDEYKENRSSYNSEQKKRINASITKYATVAAKSGIKSVTETVNDLMSSVISWVKGFVEELGVSGED
jgi:deoxyadenosine/deoxycytidine kinase